MDLNCGYCVLKQRTVLSFVILMLWFNGAGGLSNVQLQVPVAVPPGGTATFICKYNLEGEPLYTVKWYKGRQEFYRYVPKELPHTKVFPIPGVNVDISASGANKVVLRDVGSELAGKYRCEVSTDAPDFHTAVVSAHMNVISPLMSPPTILLEKNSYSVGDTVRGNCTSPPSDHPANITWYIDDRKINSSFVIHQGDIARRVTTAGLRLEVNTFMGGKLKITCVADIYNVYSSKREQWLNEDRPRLASVLSTRDTSAGFSLHVSSNIRLVLLSPLMALSLPKR